MSLDNLVSQPRPPVGPPTGPLADPSPDPSTEPGASMARGGAERTKARAQDDVRAAGRAAVPTRREPILCVSGLALIDRPGPRVLAAIERGRTRAEIRRETGANVVLADVSFDLRAGEIVALTGRDGAGAPAVLQAVADAAARPGSAKARSTQARSRRAAPVRVGVGAHELFRLAGCPPLSRWRTLGGHVRLAARHLRRRDRAEQVGQAITQAGLEGRARRRGHELDGATLARAHLARALASGAKVLLLDRPFSHLEPHLRERLGAELRDAVAMHGLAVVLAAHDVEEALRLGDRVVVMHDGRSVQVATPRRILTRPAGEAVRDLLRGIDRLEVLAAEDAMVPEPTALPRPAPRHGVRIGTGRLRLGTFAVARHDTSLARICAALTETGLPVLVERGAHVVGTVTAEDVVRLLARR